MVVSEEEYGNCSSARPVLFDNKGTTEVKLDRAGSFFFISGISGHCSLGQKMIVKVLGGEGSAPNQTATNQTGAGSPGAAEGSAAAPESVLKIVQVVLLAAMILFAL